MTTTRLLVALTGLVVVGVAFVLIGVGATAARWYASVALTVAVGVWVFVVVDAVRSDPTVARRLIERAARLDGGADDG